MNQEDKQYNLLDSKHLILQLICFIIGSKIVKYDFFSYHTNIYLLRLLYSLILAAFVSSWFLTYTYDFFEKLEINGLTQVFVSYWISNVITDNIYKNVIVQQINELDRITNLTKEISLNFIIFTGLVTIFNLDKLQKDYT